MAMVCRNVQLNEIGRSKIQTYKSFDKDRIDIFYNISDLIGQLLCLFLNGGLHFFR